MRILVGRGLDETNRREVARPHGGEEIVRVVLMICSVSFFADHLHRGRPGVEQICCGGVVLKRLVMRNVIRRQNLGHF